MESSSHTGSIPPLKSTKPFIQIDSISIELPNSKSKNEVATCEHFCIRKYVSEMRVKNCTACWPFKSDGGNEAPTYTLPPLDVPKHRWWQCESCLIKTGTNNEGSSIEKPSSCKCKSGTSCTHELNELAASKLVCMFKNMLRLEMVETRRDNSDFSVQAHGNKSCGNDKLLEGRAAVLGQVEAMAQQQVINEGHPSSRYDHPCSSNQHHENLEFGVIGHSAENLQTRHIKSSCSDEKMKLGGLCEASRTHNDLIAEKCCNPLEEIDELSSDSTEICPGSRNKSSGLQRRKIRKIRLMSDLLGKKVNSPLVSVSDGTEEVGGARIFKKGLNGHHKRKMIFHSDEEQETTVIEKNQARSSATTSEAIAVSGFGKDGSGKISPDSVMKSSNERYSCFDDTTRTGIRVKKRLKKNHQTFQKKVGRVRCKAIVENDASMFKMIDLNDRSKEDFGMVEMKEIKKRKKMKKLFDQPPFYDNNAGESCMCKKKIKVTQRGSDCDPSDQVEKEDRLLKKTAKIRRVGKEVNSHDLLSKGANHRIASVCEMQSHTSHSNAAAPLLLPHKDNAGLGDNGKTVLQNQKGPVFKKQCSDVVKRQIAPSDDIPMEIVELMAKIQYENRLHDASSTREAKSGKSTKQNTVHFSSQTNHGAFLPYHRDNKFSQLVSQQNAVLLDSPPKKRIPPTEKSQTGFSSQVNPPQQNGLNQFQQKNFYANEKIPAMNLLNLKDTERSSGQNSRLNANDLPSFAKQQTVPHGMNFSTLVSSASAAYCGNGNSSWLLHDKGKQKIKDFTAQKPLPDVQISQTNFVNSVILPKKGIEIAKQNPAETDICTINRNPADFSILEPNNIYTTRGCEIKSDFRRTLPLLIAQEKMERETKKQVTAADLLVELHQNT